jgi:basic amino acid/polyamine antiporter, APA family
LAALFVAIVYFLVSTGVQMILPAGKAAVSSAPFADAIAAQWGGGTASLAALAIAIAAFGGLNALIFASGELAYALGLRGDKSVAKVGRDESTRSPNGSAAVRVDISAPVR